MRVILLLFLFFALFLSDAGFARPQKPLINRPVRLDQSGRPVYNSWEYEEQQRQGGRGRRMPRQILNEGSQPRMKRPLNGSGSSGGSSPDNQEPMMIVPGNGTTPPPGTPYLPSTPPVPNRQTIPTQIN